METRRLHLSVGATWMPILNIAAVVAAVVALPAPAARAAAQIARPPVEAQGSGAREDRQVNITYFRGTAGDCFTDRLNATD